MNKIRQFVVLLVVVALSAGAYAVMFVNNGVTVGEGQDSALSLTGAALLLGSALLVLGNSGHQKNR